jgi:hypothetical protein
MGPQVLDHILKILKKSHCHRSGLGAIRPIFEKAKLQPLLGFTGEVGVEANQQLGVR